MCACVLACVLRVLYACVLHACMYRMYRKYRGLLCHTRPDSKCCGTAPKKIAGLAATACNAVARSHRAMS